MAIFNNVVYKSMKYVTIRTRVLISERIGTR